MLYALTETDTVSGSQVRAFILAILLNFSKRHCDSTFCSVILKSMDLRHVNDDFNTN